jgi:DNA-binding FadR family transcriptional regulator
MTVTTLSNPSLAPHHKPSDPQKASDRIVAAILKEIESGAWKAGERLPPERELMRSYSLGRSAVREAIAQLAARGVLRVRAGYRPVIEEKGYETALATFGNLVSHMVADKSGIENLFGMRVFVEASLVRHAAKHATPKNIRNSVQRWKKTAPQFMIPKHSTAPTSLSIAYCTKFQGIRSCQ